MKYIVTQEIKSEIQVFGNFFFQDFIFLAVWLSLVFMLKSYIHASMQILYIIFSVVIGVMLMIRSTRNPKRRFYQSVMLYLLRPKDTFRYYKELEKEDESEGNSTYQKRDTY